MSNENSSPPAPNHGQGRALRSHRLPGGDGPPDVNSASEAAEPVPNKNAVSTSQCELPPKRRKP